MFSATPSSCTACRHHTRTERVWRTRVVRWAAYSGVRAIRPPSTTTGDGMMTSFGTGGARTARGLHTRVVAVRRGAAVLRGATSGERTARSDDVIDNLSEMATNSREHARVCVSAGERR